MRSKARVLNALTPTEGRNPVRYANEYSLPGGPLGNLAGRSFAVTAGEVDNTLQRLKKLLE